MVKITSPAGATANLGRTSPAKRSPQPPASYSVNLDEAESLNESAIFSSRPKVIDDRRVELANSPGQLRGMAAAARGTRSARDAQQLYDLMARLTVGQPESEQSYFSLATTGPTGDLASAQASRNATPATLHFTGTDSIESTPLGRPVARPAGAARAESRFDASGKRPVTRPPAAAPPQAAASAPAAAPLPTADAAALQDQLHRLNEKTDRLRFQMRTFRQYLRGVVAQQLREYHAAATAIQAVWRGYRVRAALERARERFAAVGFAHGDLMTLERLYDTCENLQQLAPGAFVGPLPDALASALAAGDPALRARAAAITIQRAARGMFVRRAVADFYRHNMAAMYLQKLWRGYAVRKHLRTRPSAALVQRRLELERMRVASLSSVVGRLERELAAERAARERLEAVVAQLVASGGLLAKSAPVEKSESQMTTPRAPPAKLPQRTASASPMPSLFNGVEADIYEESDAPEDADAADAADSAAE